MIALRRLAIATVVMLVITRGLAAHEGPPYPIESNRVSGPYSITIWTDPDTTDDGRPGGQFWVTLEAARGAIGDGTVVSVSIRPLDRGGSPQSANASPVRGDAARQFVALVMDHEGPFAVQVAVDGPAGHGEIDSQVEATYDVRPAPALLVVYLLPFVAVGALWAKVLMHRRRAARQRST